MKNDNTKTILIATKNKDKFRTVSKILSHLHLGNFRFVDLHDLGVEDDIEERGSIIERAKQKADFYGGIVYKNKVSNVNAVLGIDDGLKLYGNEEILCNSKEITDGILSGKKIKKGDVIIVARAYALKPAKGIKTHTCITEIPFQHIGNSEKIKRIEEIYPLNHVLGFVGEKRTIIKMPEDECIEYYCRYSKKDLKDLFRNAIKEI